MLHLLGTVHNDDEEVSPSSQGQQSLRLAVNENVDRKDQEAVEILHTLDAKQFFSNTQGSKVGKSIETRETPLVHFLQRVCCVK